MLTSVRSRLLASYLVLTAVVLLLVAGSFFVFLASNPASSRLVYERLEAISALTLRVHRAQGQLQARSLRSAIEQLGARTNANGLIIDRQGNIRVAGGLDDLEIDPEQIEILTSLAAPERGVFESADGRSWLYVARPIGEAATLIVFAPEPTFRLIPFLVSEFTPTLARAALLALAGSLLLAIVMARWIAAPLRRISTAADAVVAGEFPTEVEAGGPAEVRALAGAFNRMLARVQSGQAAMKDFVANVSHELKTPLTSIQGFAQAIMDGTASDEAQRKNAARVIHDEALRLRRLAEDLLDLARLDAGQADLNMEPVDIADLLTSVRARLVPSAARREIDLVLELAGAGRILADEDRLAQVLINLVDNAIKYSPDEGVVRLIAEKGSGVLMIHVRDQGPGLSRQEIERIFERFYRLDKARAAPAGAPRGVGLGLSISQEIIRAHGGRIQVDSEVGRGSRFTVVLPAARADDSTLSRRGR